MIQRHYFRYEHREQPPLERRGFLGRFIAHFILSQTVVAVSLLLGMVGYVHYERLTWTDAFLNAAMLLGGMGPVNAPQTEAGKIFAGCYALFAGLIFLIVAGIMVAPLAHRVLHRFHWDEEK